MLEVEETLKRIASHKGITGTILTNADGIPIRSTMDPVTTLQYTSYIVPIALKAKNFTYDVDCKDSMTLLRIRSRLNEVIVVPNGEYYVIIVQKICVD
ncbi:hypothetical protein O6H91_19G050700 [Diphasiastrum complanatum]|uniref:Uncharacterized protein n=1 Tax=Diphasiastrum complanatum TaxID=34168 RepID=A0ACC2AV73_DIPCM|nr:hypothetical protein O6H91_19G050700 [Diphasiastrum complanatum]